MKATHSCCCCLVGTSDKDMRTPHTHLGVTEIYSDMLEECFQIHLTLDNNEEYGICSVCVGRLRDASDFKLQVQRSQAELRARLYGALQVKDEDPLLLETADGDGARGGPLPHDEAAVKLETEEDGTADETLHGQSPVKAEAPAADATSDEDFVAHENPSVEPEKSEDVAPSDEDGISLLRSGTRTTPAGSRGAGARAPLAMSCSARPARLRGEQATHQCQICNITFEQESSLTTHCKEMHADGFRARAEETAYACDTSGELFARKPALIRHIRGHTQHVRTHNVENTRELYNKHNTKKKSVIKRDQIHTADTDYICDICDKIFTQKCNLNRHVKNTHMGQKPYNCDICNKQFALKDTLNRHHVRMHTEQKSYSCDICNKLFKQKEYLQMHIRIHTGQNPYGCDICNKQFTRKEHLKNHVRIHTGQKPYSCGICNKQFIEKGTLTNHIRIHTGQKPYACDICNKQFTFKGSLRKHVRVHTGQKPYNCDICNKQFREKKHLTNHVRIHTGQKPYNCDICNKQFTEKGHLRNHVRIHTGQKPYSCGICNKQFTEKGTLTKHIRIHTGQKPYACDICNKQFTEKGTLTKHIRIHTRQKPYACNICNKQFTEKGQLQRHIRIHTGQKL